MAGKKSEHHCSASLHTYRRLPDWALPDGDGYRAPFPLGPRTSRPLRADRPAWPDVERAPGRFQFEPSSRFSAGTNSASGPIGPQRTGRPRTQRERGLDIRLRPEHLLAHKPVGECRLTDGTSSFRISTGRVASFPRKSGVFLRCSDPATINQNNAYEVNIFENRPRITALLQKGQQRLESVARIFAMRTEFFEHRSTVESSSKSTNT
jgi:hypothetical protein